MHGCSGILQQQYPGSSSRKLGCTYYFFEKTAGNVYNHISYRFIMSWQEIPIHIHLTSQITWIQLQVQLELSQLGKKVMSWFTRTSRSQVRSCSRWWCYANACSPQVIGCGIPGQIWKVWLTLVWVQESHFFFSLPDDFLPIGENHHLWWWCGASQVFFCLSASVFDGWL